MTILASTGRWNMRIERRKASRALASALLLAAAAGALAAPPPPPPEMEAAHQVHGRPWERNWRQDPAVFIDISPVTASEPALGLPADQQEAPMRATTPPPPAPGQAAGGSGSRPGPD